MIDDNGNETKTAYEAYLLQDNQALRNELEALKASQNKIKADAVRDFDIPDMDNAREWHYINDAKNEYANKLEAGK